MKTAITQWLYMTGESRWLPDGQLDHHSNEWHPVVCFYPRDEDESTIFIRTIEIEVDIPDDFDPTARQLAALEEKKRKASEAYHGMVAEINAQISKLQAISYDGAAA